MPGKVRSLDRARICLSGSVLEHVSNLARLAGVSCSDIVNYVLSEVLTGDTRPEALPGAAPPATGRASRRARPADVIPITRNHRPPARMELAELRRRAAGVREHARAARARAADACRAAGRARERAGALLDIVLV
jgi:hypothetical protein